MAVFLHISTEFKMAANRINNVCVTHLCHPYENKEWPIWTHQSLFTGLCVKRNNRDQVQQRHTGSHCSCNATFPNCGPDLGSSCSSPQLVLRLLNKTCMFTAPYYTEALLSSCCYIFTLLELQSCSHVEKISSLGTHRHTHTNLHPHPHTLEAIDTFTALLLNI